MEVGGGLVTAEIGGGGIRKFGSPHRGLLIIPLHTFL